MNIITGTPFIFNLLNGFELIARISKIEDEFYHLDNTLLFVQRQTEGGFSVTLQPPTQFGDMNQKGSTVVLSKASLVYIYEPSEKIAEMYNAMTSIIQVVSAGVLPK